MEFFTNIDWPGLLQTYGYWAILVGTFLEGETIVILAGICVMGGQMSFEGVALSAFIGSSLSDQLTFSLGKYKGSAVLQRFPSLDRKRERVSGLLRRYDTYLILGFRFVYGIRNVTPIILGMSHIPHRRFLLWNLTGAGIWAVSFTAAGYYFGHAVIHILEKYGVYTLVAVLAALLVGGGLFFLFRRRKLRQRQALLPNTLE